MFHYSHTNVEPDCWHLQTNFKDQLDVNFDYFFSDEIQMFESPLKQIKM